MSTHLRGGGFAVLSALAFGVTTPLIQRFGSGVGPAPTATLLYAGAAIAAGIPFRSDTSGREAHVQPRHLRRIFVGAMFGALAAPMCLAWGLQHTSGASASLLLNVEAVFMVLFARLFFREPIGFRIWVAVALMIGGGASLVLGSSRDGSFGWGAFAIVCATLGWALDSTISRPLADLNPSEVVRLKGALGALLGGIVCLSLGDTFPPPARMGWLLACGATGYGLSLRFYLLAQRHIGAARTASMFALAPFVGATTACAMGDRSANGSTLVAGVLFAVGVYLQFTERHAHSHHHNAVEHEHVHRHDDGHHEHDSPTVADHCHVHVHDARIHDHRHAPDLHHDHDHGD